MNKEKIYVKMIDGVECWGLFDAKKIGFNQFQILEDESGDELNTDILSEFIQGDIVQVREYQTKGEKVNFIASELLHASESTNKLYFDFQFKATVGVLEMSKDTFVKYVKEILRIKEEKKQGRFFYTEVLEAINKLEKINGVS